MSNVISANPFYFSKDDSCLGNQIKLARLMLASCLEIENSWTFLFNERNMLLVQRSKSKISKNILLNREIR